MDVWVNVAHPQAAGEHEEHSVVRFILMRSKATSTGQFGSAEMRIRSLRKDALHEEAGFGRYSLSAIKAFD
jgi:hypothetical protein